MHYVGVDYHKRSSYVTVVDVRGRVVREGQIANSREAVAGALAGIEGEMSAVLEAGRNWPVMYDWLEELVDGVTLAHPAKVRVIAEAKVKTDRIDSRMLAQLLRADLIPTVYVPGEVTQEQRRQLRQRMFLVRLRTMLKNRIHILIDRHPELSAKAQGSVWEGGPAVAGAARGAGSRCPAVGGGPGVARDH